MTGDGQVILEDLQKEYIIPTEDESRRFIDDQPGTEVVGAKENTGCLVDEATTATKLESELDDTAALLDLPILLVHGGMPELGDVAMLLSQV